MAESSPLAGLLDQAGKVFSLAGELGHAFQSEHEQMRRAGQVDAANWTRHAPKFTLFCEAFLDLRDAMQNPPDGFAPVAERLGEAARIAKGIRKSDKRDPSIYLNFPDLNSVSYDGYRAVKEVTNAHRLDDPFAFLDEPCGQRNGTNDLEFIERLLAGQDDAELSPRELALLEAYLKQPENRPSARDLYAAAHGQPLSERAKRLAKLRLIRDFNMDLADAKHRHDDPHGKPAPKRSTERGEGNRKDQSARALLSAFTGGLTDERFEKAKGVLENDILTLDEKLTKIDVLIPFPDTASASKLGELFGKSKTAVQKTQWWINNRKGKRENEVGRRREHYRERGKDYEPNRATEDEE